MATIKQTAAVQKLVENGGNVSRAMRQAGYSKQTAKTPQKLTESKGFEELLNEYLPEDFLLDALYKDISKKKYNRKPELELAFKLRGLITEKRDHTTKGKELPSPIMGGTSVPSNDSNQ